MQDISSWKQLKDVQLHFGQTAMDFKDGSLRAVNSNNLSKKILKPRTT